MVERLERYEKPADRHCKTEKWSIACAYESTITGTILLHGGLACLRSLSTIK